VLSDAVLAGLGDDTGSTLGPKARPAYAIALRWTGLDTDHDVMAASLQFNTADSVEAFIAASRGWLVPMQNMAVADANGHIALVSPGRVPLRQADNDLRGLAPAPGWEARYDWAGFIPADEVPLIRDPAAGYIANANQRVTLPDYPHFITHHWALPFRFQRITQLIAAQPTHSQADLGRMQADVKSLAVAQMLPRLQKAQSAHPLAAAAQAQLAAFDGTMAADKAAPLIYWAWHRHLTQQVLTDDLGAPLYDRMLGQRGYFDALEGVLGSGDPWWCDDKATPAVETCAQQIDRAFTAALDELQAAQGADVAAWQWGKAHIARSEHRPFSKVKPLAKWFEVRTPVGGDSYTVNVSRVSLKADGTTGEYYLSEHGPSLRGLYDLADRANSRVVHSTGQSGIVWSPLFRNWAEPWRRVEGVPLFVPASALVQTLSITPAP
jgi:penicillin amidase